MAEARDRLAWRRTANLMSLLANCSRDPKRHPRAYEPEDFDPYAILERRQAKRREKADLDEVKALFARTPGRRSRPGRR